jgi:hypothetical protein
MRLHPLLIAAAAALGCATLTPEGARVSVYKAPLEGPPGEHGMPEGCRFLAAKPPVSMTELEIEGQADPYLAARNEAAAAGANVLLVLSRLTVSRRDMNCPAASPITDCPPSSGAWFRVVFESYDCAPDALRKLQTPPRAAELPPPR